ncbi:glycosyltransferase family 4 protein [Pseudomonadota bacterium]
MNKSIIAQAKASTIRVAIIQPILAPYRRPLFKRLATHAEIKLKVFALASNFEYRRGWNISQSEDFDIEVVESIQRPATVRSNTGFSIRGVRMISPKLAWSVASFRPDVVICTNISEYVALLPLKVLHPCVIGAWVEDTKYTASHYRTPRRWLRAFLYRHMQFFLFNGEASRKYLVQAGVKSKNMVPAMCSVDNSLYTTPCRRREYTEGSRAQWITVGALVARKGFAQLLNAWAAQSSDFLERNTLLIVGEGDEEQQLRKLVDNMPAGTVSLTGFRSPEELVAFYAESDVFIFPTLLDIWGLTVNEAMASGLPVICSQYAGCSADLVSDANGVVVDPLDPDSFAKAIHDFWMIRDHWPAMGEASKRTISKYTLDATADAIVRVSRAATHNK